MSSETVGRAHGTLLEIEKFVSKFNNLAAVYSAERHKHSLPPHDLTMVAKFISVLTLRLEHLFGQSATKVPCASNSNGYIA